MTNEYGEELCEICGANTEVYHGLCDECLMELATPQNALQYAEETKEEDCCRIGDFKDLDIYVNCFALNNLSCDEINRALLDAYKAKLVQMPDVIEGEAKEYCMRQHTSEEFAKFIVDHDLHLRKAESAKIDQRLKSGKCPNCGAKMIERFCDEERGYTLLECSQCGAKYEF